MSTQEQDEASRKKGVNMRRTKDERNTGNGGERED
jgi:hypothetical protein